MTKQQVLVGAGGVAGGVLLTIATPELSREIKIGLWLLYATFWIGFVAYKARERWGAAVTLWMLVLGGAFLGALAGGAVYLVFPVPQNISVADAAPVLKSDTAGEAEKEIDPPTEADELGFYFHSFFYGGGKKYIQYGDLTVTNRSPRKMHLQLWGRIYYWKDNGEPRSLEMAAEWRPGTKLVMSASGDVDAIKENKGKDSIDFDEWQTKKGSVFLFLPEPDSYGIQAWHVDPSRDVYFHGFDSVTGKHVAFKAVSGYPADKVPWPFPPPKEALALDFPQASIPKHLPAIEPLDLLVRTLGHMYNDKGVVVPAVFTNNSGDRMKLQINLLTRKSLDEVEWRAFPGIFKPSGGENPTDFYALDFGPGDIADCSLIFANTGLTNEKGNELKESPSHSLLEIYDEVSGRVVWCAIKPGYPPGTDMRSFTIRRPRVKPWANSDNTLEDESNGDN